jgi:SET domain-containing protein
MKKVKISSENFEVKKSKLAGLGLFALRNFAKDERLFVVKGTPRRAKYTLQETKTFPNDLGMGHELWITPNPDNPWRYVNHSCDAKAGIKGKTTVVAKKAIKIGDEITVDYSGVEANPFWILRCACGSAKCRSTVVSFPNLDRKSQKAYFNYLPQFLKKQFLKQQKK